MWIAWPSVMSESLVMPGDMRKERMSGRRTSYKSMFTLSRFRAGSNSVKAVRVWGDKHVCVWGARVVVGGGRAYLTKGGGG